MMKSSIDVEKIDITRLDVDAIVNAANRNLAHGGGVCGAIFQKAGPHSWPMHAQRLEDVKQEMQ